MLCMPVSMTLCMELSTNSVHDAVHDTVPDGVHMTLCIYLYSERIADIIPEGKQSFSTMGNWQQ